MHGRSSFYVGPKDAYPVPKSIDEFRMMFRVTYLEDNGCAPNSDSPFLVQQGIHLKGSQAENGDVTFEGDVSPFYHPAKSLSIMNHTHGMGFYVSCQNVNEVLTGTICWVREVDALGAKELTKDISKENPFIELQGSCNMSPYVKGDPQYTATCKITFDVDRFKCTITHVVITLTREYWEKYIKASTI